MTTSEHVEHVVAHMTDLVEKIGLKQALGRIEKRIVEIAIELAGNNCQEAADSLKVNRTTLVEMRRKHKLPLMRRSR